MTEYLWILVSLALTIGWIYTKDSIRTDKKSGDMEIYTSLIAITGVFFIYKFIDNIFMKNVNTKTR
jgi:hypothetical protein